MTLSIWIFQLFVKLEQANTFARQDFYTFYDPERPPVIRTNSENAIIISLMTVRIPQNKEFRTLFVRQSSLIQLMKRQPRDILFRSQLKRNTLQYKSNSTVVKSFIGWIKHKKNIENKIWNTCIFHQQGTKTRQLGYTNRLDSICRTWES